MGQEGRVMKPTIFCENRLGTRGIVINWHRNRGLIEIYRYSEDPGAYSNEFLETISLEEFLNRIGITEEDIKKTL